MKTIICDMSGIVSDKGKNNEKLLNVFQNMTKFNYAFCTGKGYLGSCETLNQITLPLPIICENGALLIDRDNKKIVYKDIMAKSKVQTLINYLCSNYDYEFIACCNLETNGYKFLYKDNKVKESLNPTIFYNEEVISNKKDYLKIIGDMEIVRIIYRGAPINLEELKKKEELNNLEWTVSEGNYYNFCNKGTNKKFGIKKLAELYNLNLNEMVLIGNDYNDIEMFKQQALLKIAVGNSCPKELIKLADISISLDELTTFLTVIDKL